MRTYKLKVCFILDCTSSMGPWIQAAKNKILDTLNLIAGDNPAYKIYASFIGYRDVMDREQFIKIDFTDNIQALISSMMAVEAEGGDDTAEDVAGAFEVVNTLDWSGDVKTAFFITDAPNHGMMYHFPNVSDHFPDGYRSIDLREETVRLAQKGVDLTAFRINKSTDIMYDIMKAQYSFVNPNKFKIVNLVNSRQSINNSFETEVYTSIHHSIAMSQIPMD